MTDTPTAARPFPTARPADNPFDPHPDYARYAEESRARGGLPRVSCPAGIDAFLVTDYRDVRQVMSDRGTSARAGSCGHARVGYDFDEPVGPGNIIQLDGAAHARIRKLLIPEFTVRRMTALRPYIGRIVEEHIDAMLARGPGPLDFVEEFALPIPALVIAEMLGVPPEDRADFQRWSRFATDTTFTAEEVDEYAQGLFDYMGRFCHAQMLDPDENNLIGRLVVNGEGTLTIEELTEIGVILLAAGHETTASTIAMSTLALLRRPEQLDLLRDDPSIAEHAVEEMLRYLSPVQFGILREVTEEMRVHDVTVGTGEWIISALSSANRDPEVFGPRPDEVDLTRRRTSGPGHLAFGFGVHQCLGQNLARMELVEVFTRLYRRIPTLRLAVPFEDVPMKALSLLHGPAAMPVAWDA